MDLVVVVGVGGGGKGGCVIEKACSRCSRRTRRRSSSIVVVIVVVPPPPLPLPPSPDAIATDNPPLYNHYHQPHFFSLSSCFASSYSPSVGSSYQSSWSIPMLNGDRYYVA